MLAKVNGGLSIYILFTLLYKTLQTKNANTTPIPKRIFPSRNGDDCAKIHSTQTASIKNLRPLRRGAEIRFKAERTLKRAGGLNSWQSTNFYNSSGELLTFSQVGRETSRADRH